ncbi:MAG: hypothetical protein RQ743_03180 [Bacteroidales bacterium]|nr:hypothetical protein [Bacteroidales bacterium]
MSTVFVQHAKIRKTKDKSAQAEVNYITYAENIPRMMVKGAVLMQTSPHDGERGGVDANIPRMMVKGVGLLIF